MLAFLMEAVEKKLRQIKLVHAPLLHSVETQDLRSFRHTYIPASTEVRKMEASRPGAVAVAVVVDDAVS